MFLGFGSSSLSFVDMQVFKAQLYVDVCTGVMNF
jgi:hypothetical protein